MRERLPPSDVVLIGTASWVTAQRARKITEPIRAAMALASNYHATLFIGATAAHYDAELIFCNERDDRHKVIRFDESTPQLPIATKRLSQEPDAEVIPTF